MKKINLPLAVAPLVLVGLLAGAANANNTWESYHWDISTAESVGAPLLLADNLTIDYWTNSLSNAITAWNTVVGSGPDDTETILNTAILPLLPDDKSASCDPVRGRVEVCNGYYGVGTAADPGWLGIASIWVKRGRSGHIVQGVVILNDSFFDFSPYKTPEWRDFVMCQEVGHTFGLDHQDIIFDNPNKGTCMDYTNDPSSGGSNGPLSNVFPNAHDYDTLVAIYAHLNPTAGDGDDGDGGNGKGKGGGGGGGNGGGNGKKPSQADAGVDIDLNNPAEWGQAVQQDALGRNSLFERILPNGQIQITHVLWAY